MAPSHSRVLHSSPVDAESTSTVLSDGTEMVVDVVVPGSTVAPQNAALSPRPAGPASLRPPSRSATPLGTPAVISPPTPLLYSPQSTIDSWGASGGAFHEPQPLSADGHDVSTLRAARDRLAGLTSFQDFRSEAMSDEASRMAAASLTHLTLSKASSDGVATEIRADDLFQVAPGLTHLTIRVPVSPALLHESRLPKSSYLCIDQGGDAAWSQNTASATLNALQASKIRNLNLQNASLKSMQECMSFLDDIREATVIDDGDKQHVKFVDQHRYVHAYDGERVGRTSCILNMQALRHIVSLTLCDAMPSHEVRLLFGGACPPQLQNLCVWYGARHETFADRTNVLEHRTSRRGCWPALGTLRLTTRPPLGSLEARDAPLRAPLSREMLEEFLTLVRGRKTRIGGGDMTIEQDGVAVEGLES